MNKKIFYLFSKTFFPKSRLSGTGRTDLMRRVSRASRRTTPNATPTTTPKNRKTSIEGAVKHLTDLAVTISADESTPTNTITKIPIRDKKLKRTNLMKRRESQALLEGVRKNRHNSNFDSDASLK